MGRRRKRATRPKGSVYLHGPSWRIQYSVGGERRRLVTPFSVTDPEGEAKAGEFLKAELAKVTLGLETAVAQASRGPTFEELAELLRDHNEANEEMRPSSREREQYAVNRLAQEFGGARVADITKARVVAYVARRKQEVRPDTVRIEVGTLIKMFNVAVEEDRLTPGEVPSLRKLRPKPGKARRQFLERDDLTRVLAELPPHLRAVVRFGYYTGARKNEILGLRWANVNLEATEIRFTETKNGEDRTVVFRQHAELVALMHERDEARRALLRERGVLCPWVFHHAGGKPIRDFYTAWRSACKAAGVPGKLLHDLRRSFVQNCERAGIARSIAMEITGHKTEEVYRRYAIPPLRGISDAMGKVSDSGQLGPISAPKTGSETAGG